MNNKILLNPYNQVWRNGLPTLLKSLIRIELYEHIQNPKRRKSSIGGICVKILFLRKMAE